MKWNGDRYINSISQQKICQRRSLLCLEYLQYMAVVTIKYEWYTVSQFRFSSQNHFFWKIFFWLFNESLLMKTDTVWNDRIAIGGHPLQLWSESKWQNGLHENEKQPKVKKTSRWNYKEVYFTCSPIMVFGFRPIRFIPATSVFSHKSWWKFWIFFFSNDLHLSDSWKMLLFDESA